MTEHTPGPWERSYDNDGNGGFSEWFNVGPAIVRFHGDEKQAKANARLIAAAPDLLAALEVAYAALEGTTEEQDDAQDLALAALIKARGKNHHYLPSARDVARIIDSVNRCHEEGE